MRTQVLLLAHKRKPSASRLQGGAERSNTLQWARRKHRSAGNVAAPAAVGRSEGGLARGDVCNWPGVTFAIG